MTYPLVHLEEIVLQVLNWRVSFWWERISVSAVSGRPAGGVVLASSHWVVTSAFEQPDSLVFPESGRKE